MKFADEKSKELGLKIDYNFLRHIGFLFLRDPLLVYKNIIDLNNDSSSAVFDIL